MSEPQAQRATRMLIAAGRRRWICLLITVLGASLFSGGMTGVARPDLANAILSADAQPVTPPPAVVDPAKTVIATPPPAGDSSAVAVSGKGDFSALKISVSQTRDLINQTLTVSWSSAKPTSQPPLFTSNYMQIMQCWGDDLAKGPDRTQCAFGAREPQAIGVGFQSAGRQITSDDPLETGVTAGTLAYVPFDSVDGTQITGSNAGRLNPYFDSYSSNEISAARTYGDGTGSAPFEAQTSAQSPGLGCGDPIPSGPTKGQPRMCWLVIVPRGITEVGGRSLADTPNGSLNSSPLSAGNWAGRIAVPLFFRPVQGACTLGAKETLTQGTETAVEAVLRWQPVLCANNGPLINVIPVGDAIVSANLGGDGSDPVELGFVNAPLDPERLPKDRSYVYAPLLLSGIVISASFDRQPSASAPAEVKALSGKPISRIRLTARVVAKLLTQSYVTGGAGSPPYLASSPTSALQDPDFLADNPDFRNQQGTLDIRLPFGNAWSYGLLWNWVAANQQARDFIDGLPDNLDPNDKTVRKTTGMRVNPFFQGLDLPQTFFPKLDQFCTLSDLAKQNGLLPLCTGDYHPYAADLHDAARATFRGDSGARTAENFGAPPFTYSKVAPLGFGLRQTVGVTDSASAGRYADLTAELQNAAGEFAAPNSAGLLAGYAAMRPSAVTDVRVPDVTSTSAAAYPLSVVTYGVTAPGKLTPENAKAYGRLIRFAVSTGQNPGTAPGTLPDGYAALPSALRTRALSVATTVEARLDTTPTATPTATPKPTATAKPTVTHRPTDTPKPTTIATPKISPVATSGGSVTHVTPTASGFTSSAGGLNLHSASPTPTPSPAPSLTPVTGNGPTEAITTALARSKTPIELAGAARYSVLIALILGLAGLLLGPMLPKLARRLDS